MKKLIHKLFNKHKLYKKKGWIGAGKGDSVIKVVVYRCKCGFEKRSSKSIA